MNSTKPTAGARVIRECENLETVIALFCDCKHQGEGLCPECQELLEYSRKRLNTCRLGCEKPVCDSCVFECFLPAYREKLKTALHDTRARMFVQHPHMSLRHWLDRFHQLYPGTLHKEYTSWGTE